MVAAFAASVASAGGALFVIGNWLFLPESRIFFLKLIVFLSVANLLSAAAYVMAFFDWRLGTAPCAAVNATLPSPSFAACTATVLCEVQALLLIVFESASVLWTLAIAHTLHAQVVAKRPHVHRLEPWYRERAPRSPLPGPCPPGPSHPLPPPSALRLWTLLPSSRRPDTPPSRASRLLWPQTFSAGAWRLRRPQRY